MDLLFRRLAGASLAAGLALASGCITVPDELRADFAAPDGRHPNNYGRLEDTPAGPQLRPDRPTIPAVAEPAGSGSAAERRP